MKINKRALMVESILIWIVVSGLAGIHFEIDTTNFGAFLGGNLLYTSLTIGVILIGVLIKELVNWINKDQEDEG